MSFPSLLSRLPPKINDSYFFFGYFLPRKISPFTTLQGLARHVISSHSPHTTFVSFLRLSLWAFYRLAFPRPQRHLALHFPRPHVPHTTRFVPELSLKTLLSCFSRPVLRWLSLFHPFIFFIRSVIPSISRFLSSSSTHCISSFMLMWNVSTLCSVLLDRWRYILELVVPLWYSFILSFEYEVRLRRNPPSLFPRSRLHKTFHHKGADEPWGMLWCPSPAHIRSSLLCSLLVFGRASACSFVCVSSVCLSLVRNPSCSLSPRQLHPRPTIFLDYCTWHGSLTYP